MNNGKYQKREDIGVEITTSKPQEMQAVHLCERDLKNAVEEGRLALETPRGSVEQSDLRGLSIDTRRENERQYVAGRIKTVEGPPILELSFDLSIEYEDVTNDLTNLDKTAIAYGNQHVWQLKKGWQSSISLDGAAVGERVIYEHDHEWATVEELDWRYQ